MSAAPHSILVVEDQRLIAADDVENTLKKLGYAVVGHVSSGEDAIRKSDQLRPELVLMDVCLRGKMDGIQAAEIIRDRFNVPVVYLTAYADEETILRAKKTTPFGFLVKPFNERELRATIEIAFYAHQRERTLADERRLAEEKREAERREADRVLREREEMFRLLVDEVPDSAIFFLDPEGHVMSWNAGAERIKGYRADEIIGQSFVRFYLPQDVVAGMPGRLIQRATQAGVATEEGVRLRKDGSRFWASVALTALHDKSGRLVGFAKVTRDITEQKHAEQSMATLADASRLLAESLDSEQILFTITRMVVPSFADGVAIYLRDSEGEPRLELLHAANPALIAAVRDLQRKGAYHVAAPSRRVMRTGRSELHPTLTPEWLRGQEMDEDLAVLILRFGISSTIHVPIIMAGRPLGVIVFAAAGTRVYNEHDLIFAEELGRRASTAMRNADLFHTAKKERERAEEAATLRERLVEIVGHDLRNPLAAIIMSARVLRTSALATADEKLLGGIQRSANRMSRLIDQILDFTRIRSGQNFELQLQSAGLRQVCESVIDEFHFSRPDQEIALSVEGQVDALFDADRIAQVLSNLIGNAIQHGTGGPISVTVREMTADAVSIEVHNFGPAIPRPAQARIFDAFNRGATPAERSSSVGLGLFIANQIVRAHGGSIAVRSPDRDGTTFSVVLRRRLASSAAEPLPHDG